MTKMCIISSEEAPDGYPVEDTQVIKAIRAVKQKLNMASNNKLVVSKSNYELYKKKRKDFEQKLILHVAAGALLLLVSIVFPLFSGRGVEFVSVFMVLLLAAFLVVLAGLSYIPPIKKGYEPASKPAQGASTSASDAQTSSSAPDAQMSATPSNSMAVASPPPAQTAHPVASSQHTSAHTPAHKKQMHKTHSTANESSKKSRPGEKPVRGKRG